MNRCSKKQVFLLPEKSGIRIPVTCGNGRMGFIDDTGRMVLPAKWGRATPFTKDGVSYVTSERRSWNLNFRFRGSFPTIRPRIATTDEYWKMDRLGNLSSHRFLQAKEINPSFRPTEPDSHGMSMIRDEHGVRWIKRDGSEAFPGTWSAGMNFKNDDPAAVCKNGKWGFINRKGEPVTALEWDQTHGFDGKGRACVSIHNKWGIIDAEGRLVVPLYFNHLAGFDEQGMCAAQLASGCGFIDRAGKIVIPFRHVRVESFDRFGMARVVMRNENDELRVGWIDRTGKVVIPCIHHDSLPEWQWRFQAHELLPVCDPKGFGLINREGRIITRSGGADLAHVEDPIAPGRFWIVRVPSSTSPGGNKGAFNPACYDQSGKLIWQCNDWTRRQISIWLAIVFGAISFGMFILRKGPSAPA